MTDAELTKMLRSSANRVVNYAGDRIEQLTAERDQWIAHTKNAVWADSEELKRAEAERDRMREALGAFVAHYPKGINPDLDAACFAARAALKGETP